MLIYIEEAIIFFSILGSIGMIFRTRYVYRKLITRRKGAFSAVNLQYDYCWEVRDRSLKSCIGYATLLVGALNYGFSMVFIDQYIAYSQAVEDNNLDSTECEVASAFGIVSYCSLFQVTLGSITCLIYVLSFCVKTCHALGFICPMFTTMIKKNYNGIPREFELYESEFDFGCDASSLQIFSSPDTSVKK